ncbi:hypothetical protein HPP92_016313 [Vanilla planifolia]|uniref:Uncharacterized protein n=1 Tax=Vanilla planifolia TaxID=51239 RepID=A0A835QMW6_VANPL|nr:hypothetical protein HPP92_016931 [Vanilla planifolia]KAG0471767.1 hypothetical protein HPP92_016313 [Vanilla planifolia]
METVIEILVAKRVQKDHTEVIFKEPVSLEKHKMDERICETADEGNLHDQLESWASSNMHVGSLLTRVLNGFN